MSHSTRQEWERKKSYLIRSLFEDLPALSPIYERQESASPSPHDYINRCESPLPELIIEIEPKKPNFHDEPEEFYDELEKEMKQRFKKDYLTLVSFSETEEDDIQGQVTVASSDEGVKSFENTVESSSIDGSDTIQGRSENTMYESHDAENVSVSADESSTESVQCSMQQILTQVEVHQENSKKVSEQSFYGVSNKSEETSNNDASKSVGNFTSDHYENRWDSSSIMVDRRLSSDHDRVGINIAVDQGLSTDLVKSSEASISPQNVDDLTPLETMRRGLQIFTRDSLAYHEIIPIYESAEKTLDNRVAMDVDTSISSEEIITSGREMEIAEFSSELNLQATITSTPISSKSVRSKSRISKRYTKRLVSYTSSSSEIKEGIRNAVSQTSFSDDEPEFRNLWNNFFVNFPTVYRLCTCRNHVCL